MNCLNSFPSWSLTIAFASAIACGVALPRLSSEPTGYLKGDSVFYAAAAESLLRDRDLDLGNQFFPDRRLEDVLPELTGDLGGEYGWAKGNYPTLKQSPILTVAALPVYALLGKPGLLVFNLVMLVLLVVGIAKLGGGGPGARLAALVALVSTPLIRFAFDFSPDLFQTNLLVAALLLARNGRGDRAGLVAGLAVSAKLYFIVLLLPVPLLIWIGSTRKIRSLLGCIAAGCIGLCPGFAFNNWQYGSPLTTGYERQLKVENGVVGLADHTSRFNQPPLEGFVDLLTNANVGLVQTAPIWFLFLPAFAVVYKFGEDRRSACACVAVVVLSFALFMPYDGRHGGSLLGNRYLFPALAAGFAVIGMAVDSLRRQVVTPAADAPDLATAATPA